MKKTFIGILIAAVVVVALATAGFVYAQSDQPNTPNGQVPFGYGGRGHMGGGMMGGRFGSNGEAGSGVLHDYMISAFAEKLGLSVDTLNERLANGETMMDIAAEQDLTIAEFRTLMTDARTAAIDKALADGVITQEQADWMKSNSGGRFGGGMRGGRFGGQNNPNCPMFQATPEA